MHYKRDGIAVFPTTTDRVFQYMRVGGHKHAAFKAHKLVGVTGDMVTIDAEIFNPDGSTFKTTIVHKLSPPKGVDTSMEGGAFSGAKFRHSYTTTSAGTKVDLEGEFPAMPGMKEEDEIKMIDGFFSAIFAEDTATLRAW